MKETVGMVEKMSGTKYKDNGKYTTTITGCNSRYGCWLCGAVYRDLKRKPVRLWVLLP